MKGSQIKFGMTYGILSELLHVIPGLSPRHSALPSTSFRVPPTSFLILLPRHSGPLSTSFRASLHVIPGLSPRHSGPLSTSFRA